MNQTHIDFSFYTELSINVQHSLFQQTIIGLNIWILHYFKSLQNKIFRKKLYFLHFLSILFLKFFYSFK